LPIASPFARPLAVLAAAGVAALLALVPAQAQQNQPAAQAPAAQVNANPTPAQLALAKEVVVGSGVGKSFETMIPQFLEEARQSLTSGRPELAKDLTEVINGLRPEFEAQGEDMLAIAAKVVASRLSEQELKDVSAFFKSPSGQKYVQVQPYMLDDMFRQMQAWTQKLSEQVITRIRAEMKKRGHDI
jgi:hypothetical protein